MLEYLKENDPESAAAIESFFEAFGWPVPESQTDKDKRAYYVAAGGRFLIFLTDYGLILRITPERAVFQKKNPHFLMSLFHRTAGRYRIDIDPGYDCPVPGDEYRQIYQALREKYGIVVEDMKPQNLAYVPGTNYPVVIDLDPACVRVNPRLIVTDDSVSQLSNSVRAVKAILEMPSFSANPQVDNYLPLREILYKAWPKWKGGALDRARIDAFKEACLQFKKEGKLLVSWADEKNDYYGTTSAAQNYARLLRNKGCI